MLRAVLSSALVGAAALSGASASTTVEVCGVTAFKDNAHRVLGSMDGSHIELSVKMVACAKGSGAIKNGFANRLGGVRNEWTCPDVSEATGSAEKELGPCDTSDHNRMKQRTADACTTTYDDGSRPSLSIPDHVNHAVRIRLEDKDAVSDDMLGGLTLALPADGTGGECKEYGFDYWTLMKWSPAHGIKGGKISLKITNH